MILEKPSLSLALLGAAFGGALILSPGMATAQELSFVSDGKVIQTVVSDGWGQEPGRWRTQVQHVFNAATRKLERRLYTWFDPAPWRNLDALWLPSDPKSDRAGPIAGTGQFIWRMSGALEWDPSAVVATYTGEFRNGRPEGQGELVMRDGLAYRGRWRTGRADGEGRLQLPSGEEYVGGFRNGFARGIGHLIDVTGETYDGAFAAGLPDGRGRTTLPSGFAYESAWSHGFESLRTRRVRLAQVGSGGISGEDLRIGVIAPRTPSLPRDVQASDVISYASSNRGGTIYVVPSDKKLMDLWKGNGELQTFDVGDVRYGIFGFSQKLLDATPPTLQLDFQNRSTGPIEIVELRLEVAESATDNQPAVQLVDTTHECGAGPFPDYTLENYGWSSAKASKLRLSFDSGGTASAQKTFAAARSIGDLENRKSISFTPELTAAGVNVAQLKRVGEAGFPCASGDIKACFAQLRTNPVFGRLGEKLVLEETRILAPVSGVYGYTWIDSKGVEHTRSSSFSLKLYLAHLPTVAECGEGGAPEVARKSPVRLMLDATNYSLPLSFRKSITGGQTARFALQLSAAKSSQHKFAVTAVLSDGRRISSRPIDLLFFKPKPQPRS